MSSDPAGREQERAGTDAEDVLGRRIAAGLIDVGLLLVLFFVLAITIGDTESHSTPGSSSRMVSLSGGAFLLYLGLVLAYYLIFEALAAATPGKLVLGLRVVGSDGARPSIGAIVLRTLRGSSTGCRSSTSSDSSRYLRRVRVGDGSATSPRRRPSLAPSSASIPAKATG